MRNKYYKEFNESKIHVDSYTALDRLFYWEPGEYLLVIKVNTSRPNRAFERKWKFSLKEDEVQTMRLNVIKMMHDALFIPSFGQYNFAYARYAIFHNAIIMGGVCSVSAHIRQIG